MTYASHRFVESRDTALAIPEWQMSTAQWIAHQERLHGADWRAEIDRMDGEAADAAWREWFGDVPFDGAPDLTPASRVPVGMMGNV